MRRFTARERQARLGARHHLAQPAARVESVAGGLLGLHSSDPPTVFLGAWARVAGVEIDTIEKALYEDRSLVRVTCMRGTLFVVPTGLAPILHAASAGAPAAQRRRRLAKIFEKAGITSDGAAWVRDAEAATLEALEARGAAFGGELSADVPALRERFIYAEGKSYGGEQNVSTMVIFQLAMEGRIVRGRPRGTWTGGQYRWAPMAAWLSGGQAEVDVETAQADVARRWLRTYGPAPIADLRWWAGWTVKEANRALAAIGAVEVEMDGAGGWALADDLEPTPAPEPWAALLPALDSTVMGWAGRGWFLGPHAETLFDRNGNAGPTVWWDGRVVGGWAQRAEGEIVLRLLEDVGADAACAIEAQAERMRRWIGPARITPRFRTPLERELTA